MKFGAPVSAALTGNVAGLALVGVSVAAPAEQGGQISGADVYNRNCAVCHGINAQGRLGPPLLPLPPFIQQLPLAVLAEDLTGLVRNGIPGAMPRFLPEQLSDAEIVALTEWFLTANSAIPPGQSFYDALQPVAPVPNTSTSIYFETTDHTLAYAFLEFWREHGGLEVFGHPVPQEYIGYSPVDGVPRTMQLFERAKFEYHPEFAGTDREVQLVPMGLDEVQLRTHFLERGGPPEEP
ncbi:MAG TPA: cytochrome c [Chloroflexota bacterium]|nr:cytochrome c [Chloroflexota bacterium]